MKATEPVLSVAPSALTEAYRSRHASEWEMEMRLAPADGSAPYQGTVTIAANTEERAAGVTGIGKDATGTLRPV